MTSTPGSTGATKGYPSIPRVTGDVESHTLALLAIKEAIEIHERRTKNKLDSFVRLREMIDMGLLKIQGDKIVVGESSGGSGGSGGGDHGALSGLLDDDHTQYVLRSILTTNGDLFVRLAGVIDRIGIGTTGQVLTVVGGLPAWADPPDDAPVYRLTPYVHVMHSAPTDVSYQLSYV